MAVVDAPVDRMPELDEVEVDYLDVIGDLVRKYESEYHPIPPAADADMLAHPMDARGLNQAEVAQGAGLPASVVSEVLKGKRRSSRDAIGRLSGSFGTSTAAVEGRT